MKKKFVSMILCAAMAVSMVLGLVLGVVLFSRIEKTFMDTV